MIQLTQVACSGDQRFYTRIIQDGFNSFFGGTRSNGNIHRSDLHDRINSRYR